MLAVAATYLNGLVVSLGFLGLIAISLPVYVWRYFLEYVVVPLFFSHRLASPVSAVSTVFCAEYLTQYPPRCVIVSSFVLEGRMPFAEVEQQVRQKWIENPAYPELQQFPGKFLGFLWWYRDNKFALQNHLHQHKLKAGDAAASERWMCAKIESLLNAPFHPHQSPWEIHMVENYVASLGQKKDVPMTAFIMRFHHGLADGFSILYAVIEVLFGTPLEKLSMATPSQSSLSSATRETLSKKQQDSKRSLLQYCARVIYDVGTFANLVLRPRTPWHVPDWKKTWHQLYARSDLIPIERVKRIKDHFGVSFTAVILSCIAAGVSKSLHDEDKKGGKRQVDKMATMTVLPLPGHPKKLRNHAAPALFDLPTTPTIDSVTRLHSCEQRLQEAKQSTIPFFGVLSTNLLGRHLSIAQQHLLTNRALPMGLSNFPGPGTEISWNGRKGLSTDFIAGALRGVAGAGFMVLSYRGKIRIACCVENAVMDKAELKHLIDDIVYEIDHLNALVKV